MKEQRTVNALVETSVVKGQRYAEGYAAIFNKRSNDLGGFMEIVTPGAFGKTLKESDVRALWNHNTEHVLGRINAGSLELSADSKGLHYRIALPDTSYARDLSALLERRDVNQTSFTFRTVHDYWDRTEWGMPLRYLHDVQLIEVGPVSFPAYTETTAGME
jgi:HK97 family phage prohead protease